MKNMYLNKCKNGSSLYRFEIIVCSRGGLDIKVDFKSKSKNKSKATLFSFQSYTWYCLIFLFVIVVK